MPKLACRSCGREIYTVAPIESLFAEERRCPRCGAFLRAERRENERRVTHRRTNPPDDPGPPTIDPAAEATGDAGDEPSAKPKTKAKKTPGAAERRQADRRTARRRGSLAPPPPSHDEDEPFGWRD